MKPRVLIIAAVSALLLAGTADAATITGAVGSANGTDVIVAVTWTLAPHEYPLDLSINGMPTFCGGKTWVPFLELTPDSAPGATSCAPYILTDGITSKYTIQLQTCIAVTDYTYGFANTTCDVANPILSAPFYFTSTVGLRPASYYAWSDETTVENDLESHGIARADFPRVLRRHLNIDSALCIGLRRYGTRLSDDGYTTEYKRFKCTLDASNGHIYTATVDWAGNVLTLKKNF
jgi:hypothetical protein